MTEHEQINNQVPRDISNLSIPRVGELARTNTLPGHRSRLDRDFANRFGTQARGMEELVAEIGAAFFCAQWGITDTAKRLDHADYVADWLLAMKTDSRAILTAASKAQQAMDYLNTAAGLNTGQQADKIHTDMSVVQVAA